MARDHNTKQTQLEAYAAVLPKANARARLVLQTLGDREMTVSEIVEELVNNGTIPYFTPILIEITSPRALQSSRKWA